MSKNVNDDYEKTRALVKRLDGTITLSHLPVDEDKKSVKNLKVLDEETYTKDLEDIIVRDFYPELPTLQEKTEYYEALKSNDLGKLREFQLKYGTEGRPSSVYNTPATFETPEPDSRKDSPQQHSKQDHVEKKKEETNKDSKSGTKKLSLDQYLAKNTSEDNASFTEILEETQQKHRDKHAWLFENEKSRTEEEKEHLALPSVEQQAAIEGNHDIINSWKYKTRNSLMYVPDGAEFSNEELVDMKKKKPRKIVHDNTRFQTNPWNRNKSREMMKQAASAKAMANCGKIGHDGKEILPSESPQINGYGFVGTPSPAPGVDESPLMTWGEIESTPFRLDPADAITATPGPTFKIPDVPRRDEIALELAEKASKAHRDKKEKAIKSVQARLSSPAARFGMSTTDRVASMSPAAQKLVNSRFRIRTHTDKALRDSYSPSPIHRLPGDKTPVRLTPTNTPKSVKTPNRTPGSKREGSDITSLTDNLLKLPKRKTAADFF
ncbi:splicing factor ESS-2 homolog isoform X2 [Mytilus californianus]|uniref:splicing factor ESS-2 homolog isoform X2 n=1 Tax=Mytilus californianus TaxID=6549 RepID=UPI002245A4F2|nr:splicing factor ESS-2 homolog isoform X2 [Mytilus californianus]